MKTANQSSIPCPSKQFTQSKVPKFIPSTQNQKIIPEEVKGDDLYLQEKPIVEANNYKNEEFDL
jgi:hypothetical protein